MKSPLIVTGVVTAALSFLIQGGAAMCESTDNLRFEVHILHERLIDILPYDYADPAWKKLLMSPPADDAILTDADIEYYRWRDQAIVLTSSASEKIKWLDSSKTTKGIDLSEKTFVVYLGRQTLFGGSFIEPGSARAIDYPVIYVNRRRPKIEFQVRPTHSVLQPYEKLSPELKGRIELPAVKSHFEKLAKLVTF
jgi:hypothetical protein